MTLLRNPVSYSIYLASGILVLASVGESPLVVLQHLIVPYTVDVSRGFGEVGAQIFRATTFVTQCIVLASVAIVIHADSSSRRFALSILGIVFVIAYFLIITIGYIVPRFH
ncbi:MAG: hypothetical protein K0U72_08390 [Gammaproteobacteria bacterium]|nr:hypothetical protein [Gammaproteobacteria bacterium]